MRSLSALHWKGVFLPKKKLTFKYSERIYKQKYQWYKWPFRLITFYKKFGRYKNTYLLCAGVFTYVYFAKHGAFINKAYKCGYFLKTKRYKNADCLIDKPQLTSLGRALFGLEAP